MSAHEIAVALTPFGQVDNAMSRRNAGTGLGLPLAKAMMEIHGGSLSIASVPGEGTTVSLAFPAARVVSRAATAPRIPLPANAEPTASSLRPERQTPRSSATRAA